MEKKAGEENHPLKDMIYKLIYKERYINVIAFY